MSLKDFHYIYSTGTDSFYSPQEMTIHKQLVKLYKLRQNLKLNKDNNWKSKAVNRVIKNKKNQLIVLLDKRINRGFNNRASLFLSSF